ncbi:HEPN domain-containing protein [Streptomyces niveus]|uniref:ApeA N-terminal domain 1-containing protein n=1 Tax=Streptomyces niveus TaxID=193462 RepID=UPI0036253886
MTERTWRGYWWESETPETKVPGTLHCNEDGEIRLELIGGFDITIRLPLPSGNGYSISSENRDIPLIHGISGNEKFTLLDNSCIHTGGSGFFFGEIVRQDWTSIRTLRGVHIESLDAPIFARAHLRLERLLHWSNQSAFQVSITKKEGELPRSKHAERIKVEPITARHNDLEVSLRLLNWDFRYEDQIVLNERSLAGRESAVLTFTPSRLVTCKHFDEVEKDMQDLLTLSTYEPCGALSRTLVYVSSDGEHEEVEVIGRQIYRTPIQKRSKRETEILFSLADVDFAEILPAWLNLKQRARTGCNILFGLKYIEKGYVGTRLLGVATAAESIHATLRSASTPLTKQQYKELKGKLLAAISDEPKHLIDFVNQGLHNNPTYNERMLELASIPDNEAVDSLLGDREEWAKALKKSRNDLAHANERSPEGGETSQAFLLTEVTYALLCLVLMSELRIAPEIQRRAVNENSRISHISRRFKKEVSALSRGDDLG